ncbi:MAG: KOW domain-containing RNA-binding protein [Lachnospiraceae bacterium]|nr:KOW domain-containing RNA-binding protein [Lachnospiraceae bacterium]MDE7184632.1 KOW domain-containing RNA-binding protein [Lachnospiraceae bacterium]
MIGFLAYSLAGHDKGQVYLIVEETKDFVYVVNGTVRTVDKPKKKNKRHIQVIKNQNPKLEISSVTNEEIKHLIKLYCRDIKEVK